MADSYNGHAAFRDHVICYLPDLPRELYDSAAATVMYLLSDTPFALGRRAEGTMRPFHVGDKFRANAFAGIVEVRWVDPQDQNCAVVFDVANQFGDETVFATEFFDDWTIVEEPVPALNRRRETLEADNEAAALILNCEPA